MVVKKKLLSELKNFNKELDKHISSEDLDFASCISSSDFSSDSDADFSDIAPVLVSNLSDIKTEMNLLRKNLIDSVSGITNRLLREQNQQIKSYLSNFSAQLILEFKNVVGDLLMEFSSKVDNFSQRLEIFEKEKNDLVKKIEDLELGIDGIKDLEKVDFISFKKEVKQIVKRGDLEIKTIDDKVEELKLYFESMSESIRELLSKVLSEEKNIEDNILRIEKSKSVKSKYTKKIDNSNLKSSIDSYQTKLDFIEEKIRKLDLLKETS